MNTPGCRRGAKTLDRPQCCPCEQPGECRAGRQRHHAGRDQQPSQGTQHLVAVVDGRRQEQRPSVPRRHEQADSPPLRRGRHGGVTQSTDRSGDRPVSELGAPRDHPPALIELRTEALVGQAEQIGAQLSVRLPGIEERRGSVAQLDVDRVVGTATRPSLDQQSQPDEHHHQRDRERRSEAPPDRQPHPGCTRYPPPRTVQMVAVPNGWSILRRR